MPTLRASLLLALLATVSGCSSQSEPEAAADGVALVNGRVYTLDPAQPWAEAVYVADGRVAFVGTTAEVRARAGGADQIDLDGALVLPGLHDVHAHPLEAMSPFAGTCALRADETDAEAFVDVLVACAPDQVGTDWVLGAGHSVFTLLEADRPPVEILDQAIPDRPAAIMEETSHSVWVNSLALDAAGIGPDTPDPPGGVIVRDPATGAPTGVLFDAAGDLIFDLAWQPTPEIQALNYEGLLAGVEALSRNGITSVAEGRTYWRRGFHHAWLRAEAEGALTVRAVLNLWASPGRPDDEQIPALRALYRSDPSALVRIDQIKIYADGILINTTAAMLEPYRETLGDIPSRTGLNYFTEERMAHYVRALAPDGFGFHIHAIGDRGVREALDALEASPHPGARHRLTHLEVVHPADIPRFAALGVTADVQVAGAFTQPAHWPDNEPLIGDRAYPLVPLRDLAEAGARVTLSSDWDVSPLSPFLGMQNALTRAPQQLPDVAAAVRAYTLDAAYALGQDDRLGSIEAGKLADLVVLDQNLFEVPVERIAATRVLLTMLGGEVVFER